MFIKKYLIFLFLFIKLKILIIKLTLFNNVFIKLEKKCLIQIREFNKTSYNELNLNITNENLNYINKLIDDDHFEKPKISNKKYRYIELKNSLKIFLIFDKYARISTGSLLIKAGSNSEPKDLPGLSRYLQYLILFGSVNNQHSKDFRTFVTSNSGNYFSKTERCKTKYDFSVSSDAIEIALKLFANLFINPNVLDHTEDTILMILENEFKSLLNSDTFRLSDIITQISDSNDPDYHFGYGNSSQLKTTSNERNNYIKEKLIDFFNKNYNANKMTLVIISNKDLNDMTLLTSKIFINIKNDNINQISNITYNITNLHPLYKSKSKVLIFDSLQDTPLLKIVFPLSTYLLPYMLSKPKFFFSNYISSKRKGSLYYYLIKNDLATDIKLAMKSFSKGFSNLIIDIKLQKLGKLNILKILKGIFSIFEMMRNKKPSLELFKFVNNLKSENFNYKQLNDPLQESNQIQNMYYLYNCSPEKVLSINSRFEDYSINLHHQILNDLIPENMFVIFPINKLENVLCNDKLNNCNKKNLNDLCLNNSLKLIYEKFDNNYCSSCIYIMNNAKNFDYNLLFNETLYKDDLITTNNTHTKYILKNIHQCVISYLSMINYEIAFQEFEITNPNIKLFKLKNHHFYSENIYNQTIPIKLSQAIILSKSENDIKFLSEDYFTDYQRFFYFPINQINNPKIQVLITFKIPFEYFFNGSVVPSSTKKLEVIFYIIIFVLTRSFDDINYYLKKSSIELSFSKISPLKNPSNTFGLSIKIKAHLDNLFYIITILSTRLKNFSNYINNSYFKMSKEIYIRKNKNLHYNYQFSNQFNSIIRKFIFNQDTSDQSLLRELNEITIEDVININNILVLNGQIDGFIFGNITPKKSRELILLFIINLGRSYNHKKCIKKHYFSYLIKNYICDIFEKITNYLIKLIDNIISSININYKIQSNIKSIIKYSSNSNQIINFLPIDILSLKKSNNYYYIEVSNYKKQMSNSVLLNLFIGYYTSETEILIDIILNIISNNHNDELKIKEKFGHIFFVRKNILFDHFLTIQISAISSHESIQSLINVIIKFSYKWFDSNTLMLNEKLFENSKNYIFNTLNTQNSDIRSLINLFAEEIIINRYDFNKKNTQIKFLSTINYRKFRNWFNNIWNNSNKLLLSIYSPLTSQKDIDELLNYNPPGFLRINNTDYFFKQENIKYFNPNISNNLY